MPVIRGTGICVRAVVVAVRQWEMAPDRIAVESGLTKEQVKQALTFCKAHSAEIDAAIAAEQAVEQTDALAPASP